VNTFQELESKLDEVIPKLRELGKLLTELEKDEFWPTFLSKNPELVTALENSSAANMLTITSWDMNMQAWVAMFESWSQILDSFKAARGEIGKPVEPPAGLN
jgi:hypothetical protein